jgi:hypothetical protein
VIPLFAVNTRAEYYLLLIDVRGSTALTSGEMRQLVRRVETELRRINQTLRPRPVLGLAMSYGDEVAGLFTTPAGLFEAAKAVRAAAHPLATIRFVVTRGRIALASNDIRKVGGEVFKRANEHMNSIKRTGNFCRWVLGPPTLDSALSSLCMMSNAILEDMTSYQREVFIHLERGTAQNEIARKLKKHPQSISEAVKRSKAFLVLDAHRAISSMLENLNQ